MIRCDSAFLRYTCTTCGMANMVDFTMGAMLSEGSTTYFVPVVCSSCHSPEYIDVTADVTQTVSQAEDDLKFSLSVPSSLDPCHKTALVEYARICLAAEDEERLHRVLNVLRGDAKTTQEVSSALWDDI